MPESKKGSLHSSLAFCHYFLRHILTSQTRQVILLFALGGVFVSAFALIVLQSSMGGLQKSLMKRGKSIDGSALILLKNQEDTQAQLIIDALKKRGLRPHEEYRIEVLLRHGQFLAPAVIHGVKRDHPLIRSFYADKISQGIEEQDYFQGAVVGGDILGKLEVPHGARIEVIDPAHGINLISDIPRISSLLIEESLFTNIPERDQAHLWAPLWWVQNLVRERAVNVIRLYEEVNVPQLKADLLALSNNQVTLTSWEEQNQSLLKAFRLENLVMFFLFLIMTALVAIAITSGLFIFFDKARLEFTSFWILGLSRQSIVKSGKLFFFLLCLSATVIGLGTGIGLLSLFDSLALEVMPEVFVDRRIPIYFSWRGVLISFLTPLVLSVLTSQMAMRKVLRTEKDYQELIRGAS